MLSQILLPWSRRGGRSGSALLAWGLVSFALGLTGAVRVAAAVSPGEPDANAVSAPTALAYGSRFIIGDSDFLLDGKPYVIRCGEIHYPRVPREYWRHRLKLARAMGLNTVCAYLFWNYHEWQPGVFDWSGPRDAAAFCRMAQEEGLWVILRPGPYSCAEWEAGGLPWWLFKNPNLKIRTTDPAFMEPAARWLREVGRVFAPLQVSRGGPILMVQVENEYGFFGSDAAYMGELRQHLVTAGFDVPLFACNPVHALRNGYRPDLFQVVNFGRDPQAAFEKLREVQTRGPLMNGEYYPGWFVTWGTPYQRGDIERIGQELEYMLQNRRSFSLYMAHGGTTFGLWAGADRPYKPDASSYDYGAPISEAGWPTAAYFKVREICLRHLQPGEALTSVPDQLPVLPIPKFAFTERAAVFENLPERAIASERPRSMEDYDQAQGLLLYRTTLPAGRDDMLEVAAVHDFAWVFLDGKPAGYLDRRRQQTRVKLPARSTPARLELLVEAMGRVNFGPENFDRKGLIAPVRVLAGESAGELTGWETFPMPLDHARWTETLRYQPVATKPGLPAGPAFWRASFELTELPDTFLDLRTWGRGVVWVNGHCLGRFWNIGPTQTMFCPSVWLNPGRNEIVVLDLQGPSEPAMSGLVKPILDQLRPELDPAGVKRANGKPEFTGEGSASDMVIGGEMPATFGEQRVPLPAGAKGRYLAFEALESHDGGPLASLAELALLSPEGRKLENARWSIVAVDSEETANANCSVENILDGQSATFWQTRPGNKPAPYPHWFVLDLGESLPVGTVLLLPRFGSNAGAVRGFRVRLSDTPFGLKLP